jgi:uracil-DNA glycosylase
MQLDIQVPASYPPDCKLVFVGDAPVKADVDAKQGWIGASERCLQKAGATAGLEWATVARSNVVKRRPNTTDDDFRKAFYETIEEPIYTPTGKLSKRTSKTTLWTAEMQAWVDQLEQELRSHNPNLVIACGNEAMSAITGLEGITNYRGSVVLAKWQRPDGTPIKVLCVEHTNSIIYGNVTNFWLLVSDLRKAKREAEFAEIRRETWREQSNPQNSIDNILAYLDGIRINGEKFTLDVETRAGTLACFAIAYREEDHEIRAFCVPVQTTTGPYWSAEDECRIWEALHATCTSNANLCNQNIEYDIYYLLRYGVEPSGVYMDTMLAHSLLYPEFPKSLAFLCSWYLDDVVYYKGEGRNWSEGDRDTQLWEYCCKDAVYTLRCVEKIDEQLRERGLFRFYHGEEVS